MEQELFQAGILQFPHLAGGAGLLSIEQPEEPVGRTERAAAKFPE
jgi:hypothetical protein